MATSFKRFRVNTASLSAPTPEAGHRQPMPLPETPGPSQACLGQSLLGVTALFSWVLVHTRFCLCPPRVCFPSPLAALWWVNGDLLQEGLCHTHVYCTQSPCSPLLTHTSLGDTQTQFCLSVCGISGSWCTRGLFEPSERLWRVCGLILLSCWGFSFTLGSGVIFFW